MVRLKVVQRDYCPGKGAENLSQSEIESVGFAYADIDEVTARYNRKC
jgi:hypothetical protein